MRFCEVCQKFPVWGTDRITKIGYCKNHQYLRTDIDKSTILQKAIKKQRSNVASKIGTKLRTLSKTDVEVRPKKNYKSKSQLLKDADRAFGDFVKYRDKEGFIDEETGDVVEMVKCPCCFKYYDLEAKTYDGSKVVNVLHFVDRDVYSLRFDEDNAHAGCCYCNLEQHLDSKGKTYKNYRLFMVEKFGEIAVSEMELAHRKINRIEESQLKVVIEHYSLK